LSIAKFRPDLRITLMPRSARKLIVAIIFNRIASAFRLILINGASVTGLTGSFTAVGVIS